MPVVTDELLRERNRRLTAAVVGEGSDKNVSQLWNGLINAPSVRLSLYGGCACVCTRLCVYHCEWVGALACYENIILQGL